MQDHIPEEQNPSISLLLQIVALSPLRTYKTCPFVFAPISRNARSFLALETKEVGWRSAKLLVAFQARTICN
jgi:hypothetical protein